MLACTRSPTLRPRALRRAPWPVCFVSCVFPGTILNISAQLGSDVVFPGVRLRFDNDLDLLRSEVAREFPAQQDNFEKTDQRSRRIRRSRRIAPSHFSPRAQLQRFITEPMLVEMIFCPLMFYGSAREHDMDWGQFSIMFRSIFYGRPSADRTRACD